MSYGELKPFLFECDRCGTKKTVETVSWFYSRQMNRAFTSYNPKGWSRDGIADTEKTYCEGCTLHRGFAAERDACAQAEIDVAGKALFECYVCGKVYEDRTIQPVEDRRCGNPKCEDTDC